jgi:hypothetical protein
MAGFIEISCVATHVTSGGQRYEVWHDGDVILKSAKNPFYDGARAVLALGGADPDDTLVMVDHTTRRTRLSGILGFAASKTITEGDIHGPRLTKWVPYTGPAEKEEN